MFKLLFHTRGGVLYLSFQGEEDKLPMLEDQAWSEDKIIDGELRVILKWKFYEKFMDKTLKCTFGFLSS